MKLITVNKKKSIVVLKNLKKTTLSIVLNTFPITTFNIFIKIKLKEMSSHSQIVLPSKAIENQRILETLMFQANTGIYRNVDSYLEDYQKRIQNQESFDFGS